LEEIKMHPILESYIPVGELHFGYLVEIEAIVEVNKK